MNNAFVSAWLILVATPNHHLNGPAKAVGGRRNGRRATAREHLLPTINVEEAEIPFSVCLCLNFTTSTT
jgi:hypothetical protein